VANALSGLPSRRPEVGNPHAAGIWRAAPVLALGAALTGCGSWESVPEATPNARKAFEVPNKSTKLSTPAAINAFRSEASTDYRLGDGDRITVDVVGRPELSGPQVVGPDGRISLPVAGSLLLRNLTREEAAQAVTRELSRYYKDIYSTVRVDKYSSNRVIILGRVENPGIVEFDSAPTLLEILAKAGGLPLMRPEQVLTRCSIVRENKIIWIDLKRLLTGDQSLNLTLQRNDVVYIPDAFDTSIFILGSVGKPGAYRLTPQMSFLDALGQAGGPTVDADAARIHLIRPGKGQNLQIDINDLLKPDPTLNVAMEEGDILYVTRNDIAKVGYIMQKISPFSQIFGIAAVAGGL
jgi:polysaccharide export outer membrane protein